MRKLLVAFSSFIFPFSAAQASVTFDFTTLGSNNTSLGNTVTVNGVTAEGLVTNSLLTTFTPNLLWLRKEANDNGLGVCSEGAPACGSGGGDVNELSNQFRLEAIRLTRPSDTNWSQLWVSSLDSGGSSNSEKGVLYWSNSATSFSPVDSFSFGYPAFSGTSVEGNLPLPGGFNAGARYLLFTNNAGNGTNNDYLVFGGVLASPVFEQSIPEPGSMVLFGVGLILLAVARRRKLDLEWQ
jgi:hypothetical protein